MKYVIVFFYKLVTIYYYLGNCDANCYENGDANGDAAGGLTKCRFFN